MQIKLPVTLKKKKANSKLKMYVYILHIFLKDFIGVLLMIELT